MKLIYIDNEAINDLKINFEDYRGHFLDSDNQWFVNRFREKGWMHESKIECKDFELDMDDNYDVSDRKNIEIVYEAMKDLNPSNALDERLWAGVLFCQLWDFVQYRRKKELRSDDYREVLNSFVFMRGTKRSCFINCLSRLWWTGYLLYDGDKKNHYELIDMISESAYASNIILLSSNNFFSNKNLALGVLDCIKQRKDKGEEIKRHHYVEANRYLNCVGGIRLLDMMTRAETCDVVMGRLNKTYGEVI